MEIQIFETFELIVETELLIFKLILKFRKLSKSNISDIWTLDFKEKYQISKIVLNNEYSNINNFR